MFYGWIFVIVGAVLCLAWVGVPLGCRWEDKHNKEMTTGKIAAICLPALIGSLMFIISIVICSVSTVQARTKYYEMVEIAQMAEQVVENGSDLENIGITQTIIDYNSNVAKAKAEKKAKGKWSVWYKYDVENLPYIRVQAGNMEKLVE